MVDADVTSEGTMFQRAGAMAKKVLLLDPASQNSLTNTFYWQGRTGQSHWGEVVPQITCTNAMKDLKIEIFLQWLLGLLLFLLFVKCMVHKRGTYISQINKQANWVASS